MRFDPSDLSWDSVLAAIRRQPELLETLPRQLQEHPDPAGILLNVERIVVVGCGDFLYAGLAMRQRDA